MGNKRLLFVYHLALPFRSIQPGKLVIHPHTGMGDIPGSVYFLTHVRPVDVTQVITFIKIQEQPSVSYW